MQFGAIYYSDPFNRPRSAQGPWKSTAIFGVSKTLYSMFGVQQRNNGMETNVLKGREYSSQGVTEKKFTSNIAYGLLRSTIIKNAFSAFGTIN